MKLNSTSNPSFGMALKIKPNVHKLGEGTTAAIAKIQPELKQLARDVDIIISKQDISETLFQPNWGIYHQKTPALHVKIQDVVPKAKNLVEAFTRIFKNEEVSLSTHFKREATGNSAVILKKVKALKVDFGLEKGLVDNKWYV